MKPTVTIFIGAPLSGDEARFLQTLYADLEGNEVIILANFDTPNRQIDFVVIKVGYAALIELKNFSLPVFGDLNGAWTYETAAGSRVRRNGENPWQQTKAAKFALSDEMRAFQRGARGVPNSPAFFKEFGAFVCVYPQIHPDSQVTKGDHKVGVASYGDVNSSLLSETLQSSWTLSDWRRFAIEHLKLMESSLEEAVDSGFRDAAEKVRAYRTTLQTVIGAGLPPMYHAPNSPNQGEQLIATLKERKNFLLAGPSGSAKTFHLHHLALAVSDGDEELPIFIEARGFRGGDLWTLVEQGTAPLFRGTPEELIDALKVCALRPLLIVDALNECTDTYRSELLANLQAFVVQNSCRLVLASQNEIDLPGDIAATRIAMKLPDALQKRSIYAFHANKSESPELDRFCSGFTNAYDLTVAGRCHNSSEPCKSRTGLYDRYVRRCLPEHTAVASALLRSTAAQMVETFSWVWSRDAFEQFGEQFLEEQQAPLIVLDEVRTSRLVRLTDESFSFEHELLLDYFNAEHLRRVHPSVPQLALELLRPRNQRLIELIVPRITTSDDLLAILLTVNDKTVLSSLLRGSCGEFAQAEMLAHCERLLKDAGQDLSSIEVVCQSIQNDNGRRQLVGLEVKGHKAWSRFECLLCHVIALNLTNTALQQKFLELLELTEQALRSAVNKAAATSRFKVGPVWAEAVRSFGGLFQSGSTLLPCCSILADLRTLRMFPNYYKDASPVRAALRERVAASPENHLSLLSLIEDLQHGERSGDVKLNLELVRQASASGVYILRIGALELLQSMTREVYETAPNELPGIREFLNSLDTSNIMVNTLLLETMVSYEALAPPVSIESALEEMKSLIAPTPFDTDSAAALTSLTEMTPDEFLSNRAYGCLSHIFEDIFQGVYGEAYFSLAESEKCELLCLAARASSLGMFADWILQELLTHGRERAISIFEQFATGVDASSISPQEAVAVYTLGVKGCAKWGGALPPHREEDNPTEGAWRTAGEILFHWHKGLSDSPTMNELWARLTNDLALAAADVLYQLQHSRWRDSDQNQQEEFFRRFAPQIKTIAERALEHRGSLPSVFQYGGSKDPNVTRFLIGALASFGDASSLAVLSDLTEDHTFGADALAACESIQGRRFGFPATATSNGATIS